MKYFIFSICLFLASCMSHDPFDVLIIGDSIYTATDSSGIEAIGIIDDRIAETGRASDLMKRATKQTQVIDASNAFVMPGIIEGHGHFHMMGKSIQNLNFLKDTSWQQILDKVADRAKDAGPGEWIYGRGWHQEKWTDDPGESHEGYPLHTTLSTLTPDNPVLLVHASGHSVYANKRAMDEAGLMDESPDPEGGRIVRTTDNRIVGVFEERAMKPLSEAYYTYLDSLPAAEQEALWYEAIRLAQEECLVNGITSFQDAGSKFEDIRRYRRLATENKLDVRLWAMLRESSEDMDGRIKNYRTVGAGNNFFTCRAIKTELDGALGAYGAWLLEPYADKPGFTGQNTTPVEEVERIAEQCFNNRMQLCVHAIGDRANKETLDIIERFNREGKDLRWRVEHAQHLNPNDINRFSETGAIASMQAVHCTSDAPFVVKRLGTLRAKAGAYAWQKLLENDVIIVNGTDVPVEDISPAENFYASVTRTRLDNGMRFFVEQRMTREQALRSYTIDAAYGAFEEDIKGSIEPGKLADITILDTNWLTCEDDEIPQTQVLYTIVGGVIKYRKH